MATRTLAILKPDAMRKGLLGECLKAAEEAGMQVLEMLILTPDESFWQQFYAEHRMRSFFGSLVEFMATGPVAFVILQHDGPNAIELWRELLGSADSRLARPGTLRARFGDKSGDMIWRNVAHGSDSVAAYIREYNLMSERWMDMYRPACLPDGSP